MKSKKWLGVKFPDGMTVCINCFESNPYGDFWKVIPVYEDGKCQCCKKELRR